MDITESQGGNFWSPIGRAIEEFPRVARIPGADGNQSPQTVTGLGEEASLLYQVVFGPIGEARVTFRTGNALVAVDYSGRDRDNPSSAERPLQEKLAVDSALKAAEETARRLGTAANPVIGVVSRSTQLPLNPSSPCDMVSATTLDKLIKPSHRDPRGDGPLPGGTGSTFRGCTWGVASFDRTLTVLVRAWPDLVPGAGTTSATREYLRLHCNARDPQVSRHASPSDFSALTGLGEQAFSLYGSSPDLGPGIEGKIVFRIRNVVVSVNYTGTSNRPIPRDQSINGAYAAALDVAKALRP